MLMSDITKKEVLDTKANKVGYIVDVELNLPEGTISHFVLRMGLLKKVTLAADKIDKIGEKVFLRITKDEILGK